MTGFASILILKRSSMNRIGVISSMIRSAGYDSLYSVLEIEFTSGKIYQYKTVPEEVYRELLSAGSKGRYFADRINRRYSYRRV
jgi:KTSC domain